MSRIRVSFDTAQVAATPKHDTGVFHLYVGTTEEAEQRVADLALLGFTATTEEAP